MSSTSKEFLEEVSNGIEQATRSISKEFIGGFDAYIENLDDALRERVEELIDLAASFRWKAETAKDRETKKAYLDECDTVVRRFKTLLLAERIVVEERTADLITSSLIQVLNVFSGVAKGMILGFIGSGPLSVFAPVLASFDPESLFD